MNLKLTCITSSCQIYTNFPSFPLVSRPPRKTSFWDTELNSNTEPNPWKMNISSIRHKRIENELFTSHLPFSINLYSEKLFHILCTWRREIQWHTVHIIKYILQSQVSSLKVKCLMSWQSSSALCNQFIALYYKQLSVLFEWPKKIQVVMRNTIIYNRWYTLWQVHYWLGFLSLRQTQCGLVSLPGW